MRNYLGLKAIIDADTSNAMLSDLEIAQKLNVQMTSVTSPKLLTDVTIMDLLGDTSGALVLDAMDTAAASAKAAGSTALDRAMARVYKEGIDVGNAKVVSNLSSLVTGGILTQARANILINYAIESVLDISKIGYTQVVENDITIARAQ